MLMFILHIQNLAKVTKGV